jgi:2-polyprenyl-3-methyl-5-hydroxy-6-metoxy-1,4-benzoquinol methylase
MTVQARLKKNIMSFEPPGGELMEKARGQAVARERREAEQTLALYGGYTAWKNWTDFFRVTPDQAGYFAGELRDVLISDSDILEIGFGSGACLAWMREQGARLHGTELNHAACDAARAAGIEILPMDLLSSADGYKERFDTIIAFDVFEHLSLGQVRDHLRACEKMLRQGGKLLLRFPNAQSPFGLEPQMGDPTHRSALSRSVVELLIEGMSLDVVRYSGSYRYAGKPLSPRWVARKILFTMQDAISAALQLIYATRIPYDPVVVIVMDRQQRV